MRSARWAVLWGLAACTPADRKDDFGSFPIGGPTTVYDVHSGIVDSGDVVTLEGVVAVIPRTPDDDWLMVQAPEGGEYAGLEVLLHHALPGLTVAPGDTLTVTGLLGSRNGRVRLTVDDLDGVQVTGSTTLAATPVAALADWEPYNGVLVAPGSTTLLDCGELAGTIATDQDFTLDLTYAPDIGVLGQGTLDDGLQGVITGLDHTWSLLPRDASELGATVPTDGCPTTIEAAREAHHEGRLVLPEVVVTAVRTDGTLAYVQDAGGSAGLEVRSQEGDLADLVVGQSVSLTGLLDPPDGPRVLRVQAVVPGPPDALASITTQRPDDPFDPALDGALVELGTLQVVDDGVVGRRSTVEGVELVDALLDGVSLPTDGSWALTGQLRVDDRSDPPGVQLLPRSAEDWTAEP